MSIDEASIFSISTYEQKSSKKVSMESFCVICLVDSSVMDIVILSIHCLASSVGFSKHISPSR